MGITKASLHYHFATKADLGRTLIERYSAAFEGALQRISAGPADAALQLRAYVTALRRGAGRPAHVPVRHAGGRIRTLPEPMQRALRAFFALNERWLAALLELGEREGCFVLRVPASEAAACW